MFTNFRLNVLNSEAASPKNKPLKIIKSLDIQKGDIITDIGAGGGYFSFEFSRKVGEQGRVYAVDTKQEYLEFIKDKFKKEGINNITTVLTDGNRLDLPEKVDMFFLRNVFHHIPHRVDYLKNMKEFLKSDGKVAIIDYKEGGCTFTGLFGHFTPEDILLDKLAAAGFYSREKFDFLPRQSFIIFSPKLKREW